MKRKSVLIIVVSLLVATILGIGFYVEQSFKSETQVPTQSDSKSRKEYKSLTPKQKVEYKIKHLGLKNYSVLIIKNNKIWISDSKGNENGTGLGYYTFLRTDNTGKNIVIIQSNYTKRGKFRHYKRQIDKIWKETNK